MTDPTAPLVRLLGEVAIQHPTGELAVPARLDRVVLAHLALAKGRAVPVEQLIDGVWGPEPPDGCRNALQVKISRIRRHLGQHRAALELVQGSYRLALPPSQIDAHRFTTLARAASEALADDDTATAEDLARDALQLWRGVPLSELDEHPRLVAARMLLTEQHRMLCEVLAEAALARPNGVSDAIGITRGLLAEEPLRPRARLLLMRALDRNGRRAEALAVYDAGRQMLAEETGLTPPAELQDEFEALLAAESRSAHRERMQVRPRDVPHGAMETARWLAGEGGNGAALDLALRGAWWWWLAGQRSAGRDLFEELLGTDSTSDSDSPVALGATAWLAVFDAVTETAEQALALGEDALRHCLDFGWHRYESLAALLLAERLYQRGEPNRADFLVRASGRYFASEDNAWGRAMVRLVSAKGDLQRGAIDRAAERGRSACRSFEDLSDGAGQMMALDHIGYCAEVAGDLDTSMRVHQRALELARHIGAPEWQATQLTRLGSVQALLGEERSVMTLRSAATLARSVGSAAGLALAENGLGLARGLTGDRDAAAAVHAKALDWYERQNSPAGVSYTAGRLALELSIIDPDRAVPLARRSLALAQQTSDPRAIAHGLEALALTSPEPPERARALGGAQALRRRTGAPLPPALAASMTRVRRELDAQLGAELLTHLRQGARSAARLTDSGTVN